MYLKTLKVSFKKVFKNLAKKPNVVGGSYSVYDELKIKFLVGTDQHKITLFLSLPNCALAYIKNI